MKSSVSFLLCLLCLGALAQERAPLVLNPADAASKGSPNGALPRIFFTPRERRAREMAEAGSSSSDTASARPRTLRFDGWLATPGKVHAWVNGAPQEERAGAVSDSADHARLDPGTRQLLVQDGNGHTVPLRAGQALGEDAPLAIAAPTEQR